MTGLSAYECTPRQIREFSIEAIQAGLVPFIHGSPGIGKSAIMHSIANEFNLQLIDHRLSTSAPEDMTGLPRFLDNGTATFAPFDIFPLEDTPLPEGKNGWLLFLDEANSGTKMIQAAAYKLVLDRMTGQKKLHPNVAIVMAGNLASDRAIVFELSTAMKSRVIHLKMRKDALNEFLEDVAYKFDWDERIIAYLTNNPDRLNDFRADHTDMTFACQRTWEFMNKLIKGKQFAIISKPDGTTYYEMEEKAPLYAGTLTSGTALEFIQFTKVYHNLPKLDDILVNPDRVPVPADPPTRYATVIRLQGYATDTTLGPIISYLKRFGDEFRVVFFRGLNVRKPELRGHPAFAAGMAEMMRSQHD